MPDRNRNQNHKNQVLRAMQNQNSENGEEPFLPESPETPPFGPPPALGEGKNVPASPGINPEIGLPTPSLPSTPRPETNYPNRPPQRPNFPSGEQWPPIAIYPIPIIPGGGQGNRLGFCTIRFLNAAVGFDSVNVSVGNTPLVHDLQYGEISSYFTEVAGFKNVRISEGTAGRVQIAQDRFLFNDGDVYTIALVNAMEGISMLLISDSPCQNQMQNFGCVRAANLSYNAPALDVVNRTERVVFEDLRFKSVSAYRQVLQGEQTFFVTETMNGTEVFDITEWIDAGKMYTFYIIGDAFTFPGLTDVFVEDYTLLLE